MKYIISSFKCVERCLDIFRKKSNIQRDDYVAEGSVVGLLAFFAVVLPLEYLLKLNGSGLNMTVFSVILIVILGGVASLNLFPSFVEQVKDCNSFSLGIFMLSIFCSLIVLFSLFLLNT